MPKRSPLIARHPDTEKSYDQFKQTIPEDKCPFCHYQQKVVSSLQYFDIIENSFPYEIYDGLKVKHHLMIVPKRHIANFSELSFDEASELYGLMGQYDLLGYNTYIRSIKNWMRSVGHYHVHQLKLGE